MGWSMGPKRLATYKYGDSLVVRRIGRDLVIEE